MNDFSSPPTPRRAGGLGRILGFALVAFVIGLAAMGWAVSRWGPAHNLFVGDEPPGGGIELAPGTLTVTPNAPPPAPPTLPSDTANSTGRNEGLLVALAARRALDIGQSLGSLEDLLRIRFTDRHPQAVNVIVNAAKQPVTLASLKADFVKAGPLLATAAEESLGQAIDRTFSKMVVVRRKGEPSPAPAEAVAEIERLIDSGRVEQALAQALRMPGARRAGEWTEAARRYVEARRALDEVERSAIIMPAAPAVTPPVVVPTVPIVPAPEADAASPQVPPPVSNAPAAPVAPSTSLDRDTL